jgi:hypothetical protein
MATATAEKEVMHLSGAELELELRRLGEDGQREQLWAIDAIDRAELMPVTREVLDLWHEMAWNVYTDRDTRQTAAKWDVISRKWLREANGRPDELRWHNNALAIREARPSGQGPSAWRRWPVCIHEAAHAIIAHSCGSQIEEVASWRHDGPPAVQLPKNDRMSWEQHVMTLMASREALLLAGFADELRGCRKDSEQAHELALIATGDEKRAAARVKELSERVAGMLIEDKYTRQLIKVATALDERVSLSGDEFRELIRA